ncbi:MAG: DEAD/DEAH box helicase [Candidatus Omnitrophica bacterium]|nr:DEAD/DEAH box helicase [Candidatus Omnitrophota bacterium]
MIEDNIDQYVPVDKKEYEEIVQAIAAHKKDAVLNIRVNRFDLDNIIKKSKKMGVKYQTFIVEITNSSENVFSIVFPDKYDDFGSHVKELEYRPQQIAFTKAVMDSFANKTHLLAEAGTGVGKSLAYLAPAVKWAKDKKTKVLITTHTKTLQEQLIDKDLPFLKKTVDFDFKFELCVGSGNFICIRRFLKNIRVSLFPDNNANRIKQLEKWINQTCTGLNSDLPFEPEHSLWYQINRDSEICHGRSCEYFNQCFYYKRKKLINDADILVGNHHLFFANLASGNKVLPQFDAVVFDEAHTLEDSAGSFLGNNVANFQFDYLLDSFFSAKNKSGLWKSVKKLKQKQFDEGVSLLEAVKNYSDSFFSEIIYGLIDKEGKAKESKIRIKEKLSIPNCIDLPAQNLINFLKGIMGNSSEESLAEEIGVFCSRLMVQVDVVNSFLAHSLSDYVYWIEFRDTKRGVRCSLNYAPLDISEQFRSKVLDEITPALFVSATLSVNNSFDFLKKNLGFQEAVQELIVDSPFNYQKNAIMYVPKNMPDPSDEDSDYWSKALEQVKLIIDRMKGRTLVLFTSYSAMKRANYVLKKDYPELEILCQTEKPRSILIEEFKKGDNTILLATNTFWQGIDIPGEDLRCVVVWKLPFLVPDDPFAEAKMELIKKNGGNSFYEYQVPRAITMLRQGFGRLIRTKDDIGIVAVLDPRILTKSYGARFVGALPKCPIVSDFDDAMKIFD